MTVTACRSLLDACQPHAGRPRPARGVSSVAGRLLMALGLALSGVALAAASPPDDLIAQGNAHFQAGRYAEALEAYEQLGEQPEPRVLAEVLHNRAAAHFKLGHYGEARELWVRAASLRDAAFEARCRYNLGNCDYAEALAATQKQQVQQALELLDRAAAQYRDALRLDPTLQSARANLELAARLKERLEKLAERQPQSQPSQQREQSDQSTSQPSSQPASRPTSQPREPDSGQQGEPREEPSREPPSTQPASQPTPQTQPSRQPRPEQAEQEQQEDRPPVPIELTPEEAERLLQLIRDAERERRAMLRAREAARYRPVDKDW